MAATLLLAPAGAGAKTFAGIIPDLPSGAHVRSSALARTADVPDHGGPVLHWNRTHVIFWEPSASALAFPPGYESLVERFLADVAADSRRSTNVYGLSGQYTDTEGPAAYDSTYVGSVLATDPLPANGCTEPIGTGPGWSLCVSDRQLETEITHVVAAHALPSTRNDIYFLVLPEGLGTCESAGPQDCALGGPTAGSYCGYHSTTDRHLLYAVIPYNAVDGHCQSGNPRPNASPVDPVLSTISHEHIEALTDPDPFSPAWIGLGIGGASEIGDVCITQFGPPLGGAGASAWNELINGDHYYLQEEWSNDDGSCQPRDEADRVSIAGPGRSTGRRPMALVAHASDPDGAITAYLWSFGDGTVGRGRRASHSYRRPGIARAVLRVTDSSGNWAFATKTIRIGRPAPRR